MEFQDLKNGMSGIGLSREDVKAFCDEVMPGTTEAERIARLNEAAPLLFGLSVIVAPLTDPTLPNTLRLAADMVEKIVGPQAALRRMMESPAMGKGGSC